MNEGENQAAAREMPRYKCHKEVWALKIAKLEQKTNEAGAVYVEMTPADEGYAPIRLSAQFVVKHQPEVGGYYVVYQDGYQSFSPAAAFESGYTLA